MNHIGVVGGGAWGTALALVAARGGPVTLWAREAEVVAALNAGASPFLPGIAVAGVRAVGALADLAACDALIAAVPAQYLGAVLAAMNVGTRSLLLCAKGIEAVTARLPAEIAAAVAPAARIAALSGPTFAAEVARGLPTAAVLACADASLGAAWIARLGAPAFRLYASDDVTGVEAGGAVKNVLAVAAGVVVGRGLGDNARAAVIARGLAELARYVRARGGRAETAMGLSGLGDLVLTAGSPQSRNMALGVALGGGASVADALAAARGVAEGAATAPVLAADAQRRGVAMPIADAVADLLAGRSTVDACVERLLARPMGSEH